MCTALGWIHTFVVQPVLSVLLLSKSLEAYKFCIWYSVGLGAKLRVWALGGLIPKPTPYTRLWER